MLGDPQDVQFLSSLTVLYVEDDAETRTLTGVYLGRRVGKLLTATDGAEGLAVFQAEGARIVITDIRMPKLDGLAMAQEIRRLDPSVPMVVTTAFEEAEYLDRSIRIGIDHYVLKPIPADRLAFALLTCARRLRIAGSTQNTGISLSDSERDRLGLLTVREREVLVCIGRGLPADAIGQALGISPKTVNTHLGHLMLKLGLHKASALAAFAVRGGLL